MNTVIVAGFPGVGKTTFCKETVLKVSDSDSSQFSWISPGVRHPDFPKNYIDHIKSLIGTVDVIFVSTHKVVLQALVDNGLKFTVVYPDNALKEPYLVRYALRGSPSSFISLMDEKWDEFLNDIHKFSYENPGVNWRILTDPDDGISHREVNMEYPGALA